MQDSKDTESTKLYPNSVKECIKRQGYTLQEVADEIGISLYASKLIMRQVPVTEWDAYRAQKGCQYDEAGPQEYE